MKNHVMVDGQLLQTNKKYFHLKQRQKEKIYQWMFEAYKKKYLELGKFPDTVDDEAIVSEVLEKIDEAGIWIPDGEVFKHFRSIRGNLRKRINREKNPSKSEKKRDDKKPREQAIEELTTMLVYLTRFGSSKAMSIADTLKIAGRATIIIRLKLCQKRISCIFLRRAPVSI